jgi:hypothetical protein
VGGEAGVLRGMEVVVIMVMSFNIFLLFWSSLSGTTGDFNFIFCMHA